MRDAEAIKFIERFIVRFDGLVRGFEVERRHTLIRYMLWLLTLYSDLSASTSTE